MSGLLTYAVSPEGMTGSAGEQLAADLPSNSKAEAIASIIRERLGRVFRRVLVVGYGSGIEAAILARELKTEVIGVDLRSSFSPVAAARVELRQGDATCLEARRRRDKGHVLEIYRHHPLRFEPK